MRLNAVPREYARKSGIANVHAKRAMRNGRPGDMVITLFSSINHPLVSFRARLRPRGFVVDSSADNTGIMPRYTGRTFNSRATLEQLTNEMLAVYVLIVSDTKP
jgi:hypothetical protein